MKKATVLEHIAPDLRELARPVAELRSPIPITLRSSRSKQI
jgi:hypothetical protein